MKKKQQIKFKEVRVIKKPTTVTFKNKDGKKVSFKAIKGVEVKPSDLRLIKPVEEGIKITKQEAKQIIEVLNEGMPDGNIKRMRLARLSRRLEDYINTTK